MQFQLIVYDIKNVKQKKLSKLKQGVLKILKDLAFQQSWFHIFSYSQDFRKIVTFYLFLLK